MSKRQYITNKGRYLVAVAVLPLAILVTVPQGRAQNSEDAASATKSQKKWQKTLKTVNDIRDSVSDVRGVISDAENLFNNFKDFFGSPSLQNALKAGATAWKLKSIDELPSEVEEIYKNIKGVKSREKMHDGIDKGIDNNTVFGSPTDANKAIEKKALTRKYDQVSTNIQAQSLLSEAGQEAIQAEIDDTVKLISEIQGLAENGQSDTVTQDVMKKLLAIQSQQAAILGRSRVEALQSRIDTQYTNINLAHISQTLDSMAKTESENATAQASTGMESAGNPGTASNKSN